MVTTHMENNLEYRSKLEKQVAGQLGDTWTYEPCTHDYTISKKYKPDFVNGDTYIEVKGYFRVGDTQKYKALARKLDEDNIMFIMLLQQPSKPVRKGSKLTMSQWCEKNSIAWESTDRAWLYAEEVAL